MDKPSEQQMPAKPSRLIDLVHEIETALDADLYMFAGPVTQASERRFNRCLVQYKRKSHSKKTNALCFVTTYGGSADVAYQIVRSVRRNYPKGKLILFVDSICKSAGTLIALGADEIVMSDTAELGPLDIQLQKPGEIGEMVSGLTVIQALATLRETAFEAFEDQFLKLRFKGGGAISTKLAADLSAKIVVGLFGKIYAQIDPMRLGENARSIQIAKVYGERIKTANVKEQTLGGLINDYPSHGFVIDREDAATLFNVVRAPTLPERCVGQLLWKACRDALEGDQPLILALGEDEEEDDDGPTIGESSNENGPKGNPNEAVEPATDGNEPEGTGSAPETA
jgi:hypothetical protein